HEFHAGTRTCYFLGEFISSGKSDEVASVIFVISILLQKIHPGDKFYVVWLKH
nr:hypothetical protein [Chlamydiota bacterium]